VNLNATILGQAIAFVLFVLFCMKYVWPPLMAGHGKSPKKNALHESDPVLFEEIVWARH